MSELGKSRCTVIIFMCAIVLITMGLVMTVNNILVDLAINQINKEITLKDGSTRYKSWISPFKTAFNICLFHVTNPDDIMTGGVPRLIERGPYVYDVIYEKEILNVHEEEDDIIYKLKRTFAFNKMRSGQLSEDDEVVILNTAYVGSINMVASLSASLLKQYGNYFKYLFTEENPVFVKAKVKDILFDGISFSCDGKKYAKMKIICTTLKGRKPPIIWNTDVENNYMYSLLASLNGSSFGPFRVTRGVKNLQEVGQLKPINSQGLNKYWLTDECNTIKGSDGVNYPPMNEPTERLLFYIAEFCRTAFMEYKEESKVYGLKVWVYKVTSNSWSANETDCFCPIVKREKECPPTGLLDMNKCAKIPVFLSEPHFLYGDQELFDYVPDLKPDVDKHASFTFLDSFTGVTIIGSLRYQLNMKISQQPVDLLANVSDGYFPIFWVSQGTLIDDGNLKAVYMAYRLKMLMSVSQWLPILVGAAMLFFIPFCYKFARKKVQMINPTIAINSTLSSSKIRLRPIIRKLRDPSKGMSK